MNKQNNINAKTGHALSQKPKLRFSEFKGEWEERKIGKIGKIYTGNTPSKSENEYWNGDFVWVTAQDFKSKYIKNSVLKLTEKGKNKSKILPVNSVLVTCIASIGLNAINKIECATNQQINSIVCNEKYYYEFVYYLINQYVNELRNLAGQTAVPIINKTVFESFQIPFPLIEEQQKIASCLSSLDERIEAEKQKLQALKKHKKGLMQQLFPAQNSPFEGGQGDVQQPKLRFKGFKGDWEEKTLKDACRMQAGKFVRASEINENCSEKLFPCYGGNGLRGCTKSFTHNGIYPLIGRQGAQCGNVQLATGKFHATEHAVVATSLDNIDNIWLYYILIYLNLNQYATGQAQPGLSVSNLENVQVFIPKTKAEQQKIASCLSSLDEIIELQGKKIEKLQEHKKGLMQQMFPTI